MRVPAILVLATGGTIAGTAGSATRRDYRPAQIGVGELLERAATLDLPARLTGRQVASIGSEDMTHAVWRDLHGAIAAAMADPAVDAIIVTHGTDTAEETAWLLELTLPATKPVVLVGAMRAADAVGSDGLRNFANAVRVAADQDAAGRGVLLVMSDRVIAARDARKARTSGTDAFRGFPRDAIAAVTPSSLDWFGAPWAMGRAARYAFPGAFPDVPILYLYAGIAADMPDRVAGPKTNGIVLAGFGEGNMPQAVRARLVQLAHAGILVVRSSRVDEGLVDREPQDDGNRFVAARSLSPQKARILLQVLLANGIDDPQAVQAAFDRR